MSTPRTTTDLAKLDEFEQALVVRMPCCGFGMDVEHTDTFETETTLVMSETWTCPCCERTYGLDVGDRLVEVTDA